MSDKIEKQYNTIIEAFLVRFLNIEYSKITIGDIAEDSGMTRANFYSYFTGKEELLWKTFQYVFLEKEKKVKELDASSLLSEGKPLTFYLFENVKMNRKFYKQIFQESIPYEFHSKLSDFLSEESYRTHSTLREKYKNPSFPYQYISHYLSGAVLGLLSYLLRKDLDWDSETISNWFTSLAVPGIVNQRKND
jgi:AcrR family transcriptional regulator